MIDACLVMTTCGTEKTALSIQAALVDQGLAACVSLIPALKSYYYFEGKTHLDEEIQLYIKTRYSLFEKVSQLIADLHTYQVPEILMFRIDDASGPYLKWLEESTPGTAGA